MIHNHDRIYSLGINGTPSQPILGSVNSIPLALLGRWCIYAVMGIFTVKSYAAKKFVSTCPTKTCGTAIFAFLIVVAGRIAWFAIILLHNNKASYIPSAPRFWLFIWPQRYIIFFNQTNFIPISTLRCWYLNYWSFLYNMRGCGFQLYFAEFMAISRGRWVRE